MPFNMLTFYLFLTLLFQVGCSDKKMTSISEDNIENQEEVKLDTTKVDIDFLMGKFDPAQHLDFVKVPLNYANREGMFLQKETFEAFLKMHEAAKRDGINLIIISATRNFEAQKSIWEGKWKNLQTDKNILAAVDKPLATAKKILEYSSMPGTSRHHWGTDLDFNSLKNEWFESGQGKELYDWLQKYGPDFGFVQVYTAKGTDRNTGYNEEKWHYSYKPLSKMYTLQAKDAMKDQYISGFLGDQKAMKLNIVEDYILGISPSCY